MMTNTEVSVDVHAAVWPTRGNQVLAELVARNMAAIGMPAWDDDDQEFARALQRGAGAPEVGLNATPSPLRGPSKQRSSSNDSGDVTWKVPSGRVYFPANVPGIAYHHWAAGAALATPIAHKGGVAGAMAVAVSVIDVLTDPALVANAKEVFAEELDGVAYRPLLPEGQPPPAGLNADAMARWRPLMQPHYVRESPAFVP
jgi:aminobenzoyl-glutamate utilization protein B